MPAWIPLSNRPEMENFRIDQNFNPPVRWRIVTMSTTLTIIGIIFLTLLTIAIIIKAKG